MLTNKISPSMMCADIAKIPAIISDFEKTNIEYLHIDIMDGSFVPNFTLGTDYCKALKKITKIPLDIHMMINDPEGKLSWFPIGEGDYVSIHIESTKHLQKALAQIREKGGKPMVAINPATPICMLENVLDDIDGVLLMTVNPGFAGQKLVESTLKKITQLRKYLDESGYGHIEIEVDGNVSFENAKRMKAAGANIFVVGSSSVFNPAFSLTEGVEKMRAIIE